MANYDIADHWEDLSPGQRARVINLASDEQLKKWAADSECNQMLLCGAALAKTVADGYGPAPAQHNMAKLSADLFNPRNEVSADARYIAGCIVKNLWIIFVALPFVLGILILILK